MNPDDEAARDLDEWRADIDAQWQALGATRGWWTKPAPPWWMRRHQPAGGEC